jgi:hypothetical protein
MGCPKNSSTCASANLKEVRAYGETTFYSSSKYSRGYYLKADYSVLNGNETTSSTCCRISGNKYVTQSDANSALKDFVTIGKDYEYWYPKSYDLGTITASGISYANGPGHCFKCYTKDEKYSLFIVGIVFLSIAAAATVYGMLHYLIVDYLQLITCPQSESDNTHFSTHETTTNEIFSNTNLETEATSTSNYNQFDDSSEKKHGQQKQMESDIL